MLRIRRRFAMLICGGCMLVFLSLYLLLNYAAPAENEQKHNYVSIESNLQRLEMRLERKSGDGMHSDKNIKFDKPIVYNYKMILNNTCSDVILQVPKVDIQMLELYDKMTFEDVDGGVWKQGWNIKYDPLKYSNFHKLKVLVVPHSHNDPGWIQTFDEYYTHDTKHILSNALRHLGENPDMKFIWAEISFFSKFFEDLGEHKRQEMKKLIQSGQLEFVSGGWVMPDEANSHWRNVLLQLTEGQQWLKKHVNVTPISAWAIDPFGHSPSLPYILKKSGFENLLIQRTHYAVKKELARTRQLEFFWRQLWDIDGSTELFTHMMPFYSYDIPHTCGPDPKICCQFDFKRMGYFGIKCPWRVPPKAIDDANVRQRSAMLIDQWMKKAELYRTNVLLVPLGDDFRFKQSTEWEVQRVNYEKLFEYINDHNLNVEVSFGTLQEYFNAVKKDQSLHQFPSLTGDFFTYADRSDNYWSGYFTSRPYHKRMDRVLMHYVRAADMLHAWHSWDESAKFNERLQKARQDLSLFQHHDGITGTAKAHVVTDYEERLMNSVRICQFVMQQAVYRLLTDPKIYLPDYEFNYFTLDDARWPGPDDSRTTIILGDGLPTKHIVLHNTLPQWREELVDFYISSPHMSVTDFSGTPVPSQITPVWSWHYDTISNTINPQASTTKYRLLFKARIPPLGLVTYIIRYEKFNAKLPHRSFASNLILTTNPMSIAIGDYPQLVEFGEHREMSLTVGNGPTVAFTVHGFMKSIQLAADQPPSPIHLKFLKYGNRIAGDHSGAYLFLPGGPATPVLLNNLPVLVTKGPLESTVSVGMPFGVHQTILRGGPPEIQNLIDIKKLDNTEIVMRFSTHIENGDLFYTDLNGLQYIKRARFRKLPLQANYYPIPTGIYIEDANMRLTVVSGQPLGGSSLNEGEIEIMQDRRLSTDDERGMGEGVLDNKPVLHIFRILMEKLNNCVRTSESNPAGYLTTAAYQASKTLLDPVDKFIYSELSWSGALESFGAERSSVHDELDLAVMRNIPAYGKQPEHTGYVMHRTKVLQCGDTKKIEEHSAKLDVCKLLEATNRKTKTCYHTTLTFLKKLQTVDTAALPCSMDTVAYAVEHS